MIVMSDARAQGSAVQCHYSGSWLRLALVTYGKPYSCASEVKGKACLMTLFDNQPLATAATDSAARFGGCPEPGAVAHFLTPSVCHFQAFSWPQTCTASFLSRSADGRIHLPGSSGHCQFILFFNLFKPSQRFCRTTCGCFRFVLEIFSPVQLRMKC